MRVPKILFFSFFISIFCALNTFAQTFVSTPVGQFRATVKGTGDFGSEAITVLGVPLENAIDASGELTAVAGTSLSDNLAAWAPGAFSATHYVQITSGVNAGVSATILDNTVILLC